MKVRGFYFQAKPTDSHIWHLWRESQERKNYKMAANTRACSFRVSFKTPSFLIQPVSQLGCNWTVRFTFGCTVDIAPCPQKGHSCLRMRRRHILCLWVWRVERTKQEKKQAFPKRYEAQFCKLTTRDRNPSSSSQIRWQKAPSVTFKDQEVGVGAYFILKQRLPNYSIAFLMWPKKAFLDKSLTFSRTPFCKYRAYTILTSIYFHLLPYCKWGEVYLCCVGMSLRSS